MKTNRKLMMVMVGMMTLTSLAPSQEINQSIGHDGVPAGTRAAGKFLVDRGALGQKERPKPFEGPIEPQFPNRGVERGSPFEMTMKSGKDARADRGRQDVIHITQHPQFADLVETDSLVVSSTADGKQQTRDATASWPPRVLSPVDGSTLEPVQTFTWNSGGEDYWLWIGSCRGCADLFDYEMGVTLSTRVNLPMDGRQIYVTLWTYWRGDWYYSEHRYVATSGRQPGIMDYPADGSTLGATQNFHWTTGSGVSEYVFALGSCERCYDLYIGSTGLANSITLNNLPNDGRVLWATVYSNIEGDWFYDSRQYRAGRTPIVDIEVENFLIYPVILSIDGQTIATLGASAKQTYRLTTNTFQLSFKTQQPTINGRTLGDSMSGIYNRIVGGGGKYRFEITNVIGDSHFFAPLITNHKGSNLYIRVNGGLLSQNNCNCYASPGSTRVGTGYYRLFGNGNVMLFYSGSYTGSYMFWGKLTDGRVGGDLLQNLVRAKSGFVELVAR